MYWSGVLINSCSSDSDGLPLAPWYSKGPLYGFYAYGVPPCFMVYRLYVLSCLPSVRTIYFRCISFNTRWDYMGYMDFTWCMFTMFTPPFLT